MIGKLSFALHDLDGRAYLAEGPTSDQPAVVLLHGLLGDLSNWESAIGAYAAHGYRVVAPVMPIFELPLRRSNIPGLVDYLHAFLTDFGVDKAVLVGNSLGGHVALLYALQYPERVHALILAGSSGIYELETGTEKMRRKDPEYIRERAALTFYDPRHATDQLVEEMVEIVNDRVRALRLIRVARSAQRETVTDRLPELTMPSLLVWGTDDQITPPDVAHIFNEHMQDATLHFIDKCGHAPMIERPDQFNEATLHFLGDVIPNGQGSKQAV